MTYNIINKKNNNLNIYGYILTKKNHIYVSKIIKIIIAKISILVNRKTVYMCV